MTEPQDLEARITEIRRRLEQVQAQAGDGDFDPETLREDTAAVLRRALRDLSDTLGELTSANVALAEAELGAERHARRYADLFRLAPDAYLVTDEHGLVRALNAEAEARLQGPARTLVGRPLVDRVAPSDRPRFLAHLDELRTRHERLSDVELRFLGPPAFVALVTAVPEAPDAHFEIRWMLRDVSGLRQRDTFREQIERYLQAVVWLLEIEPLRMLHVSAAYQELWGRPVEALLADPRDWIEAVHSADRPRIEAAFERLLVGEPFDEEYRIVRPDGATRWIHGRATPFASTGDGLDRATGLCEDTTARKRTEQALQEAETRRRAAALAAENAEARERRALASDLHDAVGQSLALVRTRLAALRNDTRDPAQASALDDVAALVAGVSEEIRHLTFRLSPPILHDLGVAAAAEWLADDLFRQFGLRVTVEDRGLQEPPSGQLRTALFRSLRELLVNVARHAGTDRAHVTLAREGDALLITVDDDGVGWDGARTGGGFGLASIRERIEALAGALEIGPGPTGGTRARLVVPGRPENR